MDFEILLNAIKQIIVKKGEKSGSEIYNLAILKQKQTKASTDWEWSVSGSMTSASLCKSDCLFIRKYTMARLRFMNPASSPSPELCW